MKPNSSRSQSSEIFLVCLKYTAPKHIDPKLLDPNHVFKEVKDPGLKKVDVLHKKYEKLNKRHRTGYDESMGPLLSKVVTVSAFLSAPDPVQVLTEATELRLTPDCQEYADHESTSYELKECFKDLRVLGKVSQLTSICVCIWYVYVYTRLLTTLHTYAYIHSTIHMMCHI